jgi:hypothetical protein
VHAAVEAWLCGIGAHARAQRAVDTRVTPGALPDLLWPWCAQANNIAQRHTGQQVAPRLGAAATAAAKRASASLTSAHAVNKAVSGMAVTGQGMERDQSSANAAVRKMGLFSVVIGNIIDEVACAGHAVQQRSQ